MSEGWMKLKDNAFQIKRDSWFSYSTDWQIRKTQKENLLKHWETTYIEKPTCGWPGLEAHNRPSEESTLITLIITDMRMIIIIIDMRMVIINNMRMIIIVLNRRILIRTRMMLNVIWVEVSNHNLQITLVHN